MARTYRKYIKCGCATGTNTEFYRALNRKCRAKNRHVLRNLIANKDIETVSEEIQLAVTPIHDSWNEPTDGTFLVSPKDKDFYVNDAKYYGVRYRINGLDYWNTTYGRYLKPKH